jgi:hypothetical protein
MIWFLIVKKNNKNALIKLTPFKNGLLKINKKKIKNILHFILINYEKSYKLILNQIIIVLFRHH